MWFMSEILAAAMTAGGGGADSLSTAGSVAIKVSGEAKSITLTDMKGRTCPCTGDIPARPIPDCNCWDRDETEDPNAAGTIDLSYPLAGSYRLNVVAVGGKDLTLSVFVNRAVSARCGRLEQTVHKARGRYEWKIEFLRDTTEAACPVRVSPARKVRQ